MSGNKYRGSLLILKKILILFFSPLLVNLSAFSQDDKSILKDLLSEDKRTIEALALYPDATKKVILESAGYPDALARMESIHEKTQGAFRDIIFSYDQDTQAQFYELARYPDLILELVKGEKKSKAEIRMILEKYPEEIHDAALALGRKRYQELSEIQALNQAASEAFGQMLNDYPPGARRNLEQLLSMPEVLDILMKNFQSTVMMGAIYKRDPDWVWHVTDSIQMEIAQKSAEELADWKANLESDPEALKELETAAADFAEENGYDSRVYRNYLTEDDFYYKYRLHYLPYSYWFGYPHWYVHPFWYPRPYWYYWGFYYGPGGRIVIFDFPSWYFVDWYFSYSPHHYYYPHLSHRYLTHYERHRNSSLSATTRIRNWTMQNRDTYSRDWLRDDDRRVERLRDFGLREAMDPPGGVRTYTRPSVQRPPTEARPTRPSIQRPPTEDRPARPTIKQPATRKSQEEVRPPTRGTETQRPVMRAPEFHEQQLKKREPPRVSPTQSRKSTTLPPAGRTQEKRPVSKQKKRN